MEGFGLVKTWDGGWKGRQGRGSDVETLRPETLLAVRTCLV